MPISVKIRNEEESIVDNAVLEDAQFENQMLRVSENYGAVTAAPTQPTETKQKEATFTQWALGGNGKFSPVGASTNKLEAGIYEPYSDPGSWGLERLNVSSDEIYELPDMATNTVLDEAQRFWDNEARYRKHSLLYKRGILLYGPPGSGKCLGRGTPVLMFNGEIKAVETIRVGDVLMGDDSTPRHVLSLARGREQMYRIVPTKGDSYVVNESHILSLKRSGSANSVGNKNELLDISVRDFLNRSKTVQTRYKGYRVGVSFTNNSPSLPIDPYFLGVWLGDGTSRKPSITTMDAEIVNVIYREAAARNLEVRVDGGSGLASNYHITATNKAGNNRLGKNSLYTDLVTLNVIQNKHIPTLYLTAPKNSRLLLLAGLLDSDGYLGCGVFQFANKSKQLADNVTFLARSLGLAAYITETTKRSQLGAMGIYYNVSISGNTNIIPTKLERKRALPRKQIKDVLVTGIAIEPLGVDDYYGFEIDGNRRFLLGDFTVTHNTVTIKLLMKKLIARDGIVIVVHNVALTAMCLKALKRIEPDRNLICIFEDIDEILQSNGESVVLSMLDGEHNVDRVMNIASTNYADRLGARIINRPSRFDRIMLVDMPADPARRMYLQNATNGLLSVDDVNKWVLDTEGMSIAHLRELVAAVYCLEQPYKDVIDRLRKMATKIKTEDEFKQGGSTMGFVTKKTSSW